MCAVILNISTLKVTFCYIIIILIHFLTLSLYVKNYTKSKSFKKALGRESLDDKEKNKKIIIYVDNIIHLMWN